MVTNQTKSNKELQQIEQQINAIKHRNVAEFWPIQFPIQNVWTGSTEIV